MQERLTKVLSAESIKEILPVYMMILLYTLVFSFAMIAKFYALQTYAYDLGNYNQALYTTLRGHGLLYYTADLPVTGGSMMGVHFSPILLMILPIYAIYPAAPSLLIIKSFALALGTLPMYKLAKHLFKTKYWGYLFSAVYLLNPALQGINWFDFHPEAFFPTFCLFSLYYGLKKDWLKYVLFTVLTLTTTEYAAILISLESVYFILVHKEEERSSLHASSRLEFRNINANLNYPLITVALAIIWFYVAILAISIFSENPILSGGAPQWKILGAHSTLTVPLQVLISPQRALAALLYDWPIKLAYLIILFGSTAFLAFLNSKTLIITVPWFMVALLSNYYPFYYVGNQYPAFLLPSIMVASVLGAKRFLEFASKGWAKYNMKKRLPIFLLITAFTFSILSSPLYGFHLGDWPDLTYGPAQITEHDRIVLNFSQLIPSDATVLTQQNIFPLLSSRINAYVVPLGSFYPPGKGFNTTLNEWLDKSDFALFDLKTSFFETYLIYTYLKDFGHLNDFGVYASMDGVILLKRNYTGNPYPFIPYGKVLNWDDLTLERLGELIVDQNSSSYCSGGYAFLRRANTGPLNDFFCGPPIYLPPGEYEAIFKLKVKNSSSSKIATLTVWDQPFYLNITESGTESSGHKYLFSMTPVNYTTVYASRELFGSDFAKPNTYQKFTVTFSLNLPASVEFSATDVSDEVDIYLDWVNVIQLSAFP